MAEQKMGIYEKLSKVQNELKAPKSEWNDFSKFAYRTQEGILEVAKPILAKYGLTITLNDTIEMIGNRFYIKATAVLTDESDQIHVDAYAREQDAKKGMDDAQLTGATSSYARKYALCGLFAISNSSDADEEGEEESEGDQQQENKLDQALLNQCGELKIKLEKVASYKQKEVNALTNADLQEAIKQQIQALKKREEAKKEKAKAEAKGDQ